MIRPGTVCYYYDSASNETFLSEVMFETSHHCYRIQDHYPHYSADTLSAEYFDRSIVHAIYPSLDAAKLALPELFL